MSRKIDYYFSLISPWAYIGQATFNAISAKHDLEIAYYPVSLADLFSETGGTPFAKRHPARLAYRMMELQRWREKRGLAFHLKPKHWPFNPSLADRIVLTIAAKGIDPAPYVTAVFKAVFEEQADLGDALTLIALMDRLGLSGTALAQAAEEDSVIAAYRASTDKAMQIGVFGSPAYVLDGEIFWGQDRLSLLDEALTSRRKPYGASAS